MRKTLVVLCMMGASLYASNCETLVRAYPDWLKTCSGNTLYWKDGTKMRYDNGRSKSFDQLLNHPDLEDMFRYRYYTNYSTGLKMAKKKNYDPGRIRYEPFFKKMYGNSASQVRRHLTTIDWFGQKIRVTTVNGVASHLLAVERELKRYPELRKYLVPIGGTFNWRHIAGTRRLSVHSFGAAIDINTKYSAYWRWSKSGRRPANKIPRKIVETFEKHGFIWGGKWYHYDTMHFEYRPEILRMQMSTKYSDSGDNPAHHSSRSSKRKYSTKSSHQTMKKTRHGAGYEIHTVQSGESLYAIARKFNRKNLSQAVQELKAANNLTNDQIRVGQKLTIPW